MDGIRPTRPGTGIGARSGLQALEHTPASRPTPAARWSTGPAATRRAAASQGPRQSAASLFGTSDDAEELHITSDSGCSAESADDPEGTLRDFYFPGRDLGASTSSHAHSLPDVPESLNSSQSSARSGIAPPRSTPDAAVRAPIENAGALVMKHVRGQDTTPSGSRSPSPTGSGLGDEATAFGHGIDDDARTPRGGRSTERFAIPHASSPSDAGSPASAKGVDGPSRWSDSSDSHRTDDLSSLASFAGRSAAPPTAAIDLGPADIHFTQETIGDMHIVDVKLLSKPKKPSLLSRLSSLLPSLPAKSKSRGQ